MLPPLCIGAVVHQVLMGLSYLHRQRRIIHRGLHPGNILLDCSGRCVARLVLHATRRSCVLTAGFSVALSDFTSSSILEKTFAQACTYATWPSHCEKV